MEVQIASAVGNSRVAWFLPYSIDMVTSYGHLFSDEQPCCSVTTVCSADSCMSPCIPQVTGTVTNPNNMLLPNSTNSATVGSIFASGTHTAVFPTSVAVNGVPCGLVVSAYKAPAVALQRAVSMLGAAAPGLSAAQQR